jgi:hypothetical protein
VGVVVVARTHSGPKLPSTLANQVVLNIRVQIINNGGLVVITAVITKTCIILLFVTFALETVKIICEVVARRRVLLGISGGGLGLRLALGRNAIVRSHNLKREIDSITAELLKNHRSVSNEGTPNIGWSLEGRQHGTVLGGSSSTFKYGKEKKARVVAFDTVGVWMRRRSPLKAKQ